jgi:hypothetical protein
MVPLALQPDLAVAVVAVVIMLPPPEGRAVQAVNPLEVVAVAVH